MLSIKRYTAMSCVLIFFSSALFGQSRADKLFERLAYTEAIPAYESAVNKDENNQTAKLRLGDCYRLTNNYTEAARWYGEAAKSDKFPSEYKLHYGMMLQSAGKCEQAVPFFEAYAQEVPGDSRGAELASSCEQSAAFHADRDLFTINHPEEVNSASSDFGPAFYNDGIVFSSARRAGNLIKRRHAWTGDPFLDLFFAKEGSEESESAKFGEPEIFSSKLNTRFHEGPMTFDEKNKKVYFTRNNFVSGKKGKSKDGTVKLKILEADLKSGKSFDSAKEMPFCSDEYSVGHPSLSADGERLYFASDMPGGLGGSDIWYVEKEGNTWGTPVNCGSDVNTEGEESFPFSHDDGTLYFASDGHAGLGGLDVFSATASTANYTGVRNMGFPLNTESDDFGLIWDAERKMGYFSSNRSSSLGSDDIYTMRKVVVILEGFVYDKETDERLHAAVVKIEDGEFTKDYNTDAAGEFRSEVSPNRKYTLSASLEGYGPGTASLSSGSEKSVATVEIPLVKLITFDGSLLDENGNPIEGFVKLIDAEDKVVERVKVSPEGVFEFAGVPKGEYRIETDMPEIPAVSLPAAQDGVTLTANLVTKDGNVTVIGCNLGAIYYDYGKFEIRKDAKKALMATLSILLENPTYKVEVSSHTDSRSSSSFNNKLSRKRTNSAAAWLLERGISDDRLIKTQWGETKLVNDCTEGVDCPEDAHQKNRRTEFKCVR